MIVLAVVVAGHQAALVGGDRVAARGVRAAPVDGAAVARNTRPTLLVEQVTVQAQLEVVALGGDKVHAGIGIQNGGLQVDRHRVLAHRAQVFAGENSHVEHWRYVLCWRDISVCQHRDGIFQLDVFFHRSVAEYGVNIVFDQRAEQRHRVLF